VPSHIDKVVKSIEFLLKFADNSSFLDVSAYNVKNFRNPLSRLRKYDREQLFSVSLTNTLLVTPFQSHQSDYSLTSQLQSRSADIYKGLREIWELDELTVIPYGYFPYSARDHYGEKYETVADIKKTNDPHNLFSGGINLFHTLYDKIEYDRNLSPKPKAEAPKVEPAKAKAPKAEVKADSPKIEALQVEVPKIEAPKVEPAKAEVPKIEEIKPSN